jgi:hypothetical protein
MVSLADIVPQTREVEITSGTLKLRGLGLRHIADLFLRFPEIRKLFDMRAPEINVPVLIVEMPDAIGAIIAEAAGEPDMADHVADALSPGDATACFNAIMEMTQPGPFFHLLAGMAGTADAPDRPGRAADTNSPPQPSSSSVAGMTPAPSSTIRRANSQHSSPSPATADAVS